MTDTDPLVTRLLDECARARVTGDEGPVADELEAEYRAHGETVVRVGNSLVVGRPSGDRPLVLLVGHLDVVPPTDDDRRPRLDVRDGTPVVVGRGSSDMIAGNVVAISAFEDVALRARSPYDLALVLYAGEEGPADGNELVSLLEEVAWLRDAALAIVLEPTDGEVQLGCLGGLHALVTFRGRQAHSARPWHGRNALTMAGEFLEELERDHVRDVVVDGIAYRDVWSATQGWTSGLEPGKRDAGMPPRNVLPASFTVNLNFRFAPMRGLDEAERELRERVGARADVEIVDRTPPAPPQRDHELVQAFVNAVDAPVRGKQAWTDVARFTEVGVPALNFGPGLTAQAHQRGEYVPIHALGDADHRLRRFLGGRS